MVKVVLFNQFLFNGYITLLTMFFIYYRFDISSVKIWDLALGVMKQSSKGIHDEDILVAIKKSTDFIASSLQFSLDVFNRSIYLFSVLCCFRLEYLATTSAKMPWHHEIHRLLYVFICKIYWWPMLPQGKPIGHHRKCFCK